MHISPKGLARLLTRLVCNMGEIPASVMGWRNMANISRHYFHSFSFLFLPTSLTFVWLYSTMRRRKVENIFFPEGQGVKI